MASETRPATGPAATPVPDGKPTPIPSEAGIVRIHVDRDFAQSLDELISDADVIAVGTLLMSSREYSRSSDDVFAHMAHGFAVDQVIKGSVTAGTEIQVIRSVRLKDNAPVIEFDERPLQPERRYLLFLRLEDDVFVTVGGPQGQFEVSSGRVLAVSNQFSTGAAFDGRTIADAIAIMNEASTP